jgi:hypothetical protein
MFIIVFEILLHYLESQNWKEAFLKVIPARKGVRGFDNLVPSDDSPHESATDDPLLLVEPSSSL